MDSGEWGKDWFGSSSSERHPLLTSSGHHLRRPFDADGRDYVYCGFHIRKIAFIICFWELVAVMVTFIISCSLFSDQMGTAPQSLAANQNVSQREADHYVHATRIFSVSLVAVVIGLPSLIMAMYGIRKERISFLIPHMGVQLVAILVSAAFFILAAYEASQYSATAHQWAGQGNVTKRDHNYQMMTYHIELAVFLAIVIATEAIFFLVSRRCVTYFKTKRLVEEGLLIPAQVATLKKEFQDTYVF